MTNFFSAIKSGLEAAVDREKNFLEILEVLDVLRAQIESYSEDKVTFTLDDKQGNNYFFTNDNIYSDRNFWLTSKPEETYRRLITKINFDKNGYPLSFNSEGDILTALDKEGLEINLSKLISSPTFGESLYTFMKLKEK